MSEPASRIVTFYEGHGRDHRGRTLALIQGFSHETLEDVHDYIQWLFPLSERSAFNAHAPLLTDSDVAAFRARPELRTALRRSLEVYLDFLGLTLSADGTQVTEQPGPEAARRRVVFHEPDHNWLRITRVLLCLGTLGLETECHAFFAYLSRIYQKGIGITADTFEYWCDADRRAGS